MCFEGSETGVFSGLRLTGVFSGLTAVLRVQGVRPAAVAQCEERGAKPPGDVLGTRSAE